MIDDFIEYGELDNKWYRTLITSNDTDYIIDNELYSIYRNGIQVISIPDWIEPSKADYCKFTPNFRYNLPRIYTLYKLNGSKKSNSIIPFMKWKYKMTDESIEKLQRQFNKFKNVLDVSIMDDLKYKAPFPDVEPRVIEEIINGQYIERLGYSNQEYKHIESNKEYNKSYKKKKKKIISAAIVFERMMIKNNEDKKIIDLFSIRKNDNIKRLNDVKNNLKRFFEERYLIKETRYIILNKGNGGNSLFYHNKEYNFLSINYYNNNNEDDLKRMREIEREYNNKGIGLLKEKQNSKLVNYGITWLQSKSKITIKWLSIITGKSIPTINKYIKNNWRYDNDKLF